jgi:hypothetical protein
MKSSILRSSWFETTGRKVALALVLVTTLGSLSLSPALAARDDGDRRDNRDGRNGRQDNRDHRQWQSDHRGNFVYQQRYRHPYNYAQPVYVPPPVYYEPQQSPGINLFFPLDLRR